MIAMSVKGRAMRRYTSLLVFSALFLWVGFVAVWIQHGE